MLFIPLLALFIALSLGKPEKFRLPDWSNVLYIVSILLLMAVLTNDDHQLVFGFPNGLLSYDNNEYTHLIIYYVIVGWISFCSISAFAFIVVKCRVPYSKKRIYLPSIPLLMIVVYAVLYLVVPDFIEIIAGDMTVTICLLVSLAFEACIQSGLIQSNKHYNELFKCSDLRAIIADDDYNTLLFTANAKPISKEVMQQTEKGSVMIDEGIRLCGSSINAGHVMWMDDISKISKVINELADNSEYLSSKRLILQKEVETRKEEQRLTEQNRLYNRLMNDNQDKYELFNDLLSQLEATNDVEQEKHLTAKLAIVCTHIKRRGNLLFIIEKGEKINASELQFAIEEWLSNLRLCGVKCSLYFNMNSTIDFAKNVSLYDGFQWVLLHTIDTLHSLLVTVNEVNGEPSILLNISCDSDLSKLTYPNVIISDEDDGEWIITINIPKGGDEA